MVNSNKYTVLVMRDDTQVRRMRFSPFWLKFFLWFLLILTAVAGAGSWGSYYFWEKGRAQKTRLAQLERQNADLGIKLERLQNMETLIGASESTPLDPVLDTGPTATTPTDDKTLSGVGPGDLPALVDVAGNATETGNATAAETLDADNATAPGGEAPVKLENINLRANSNKTLRLGVSFVNTTGKPIRGYASLTLLTPSGEVPATVPSDDLDFQMTRMKRATTTFPLPENVNMDDVEAVRINVFVDEAEVMSQDVALER